MVRSLLAAALLALAAGAVPASAHPGAPATAADLPVYEQQALAAAGPAAQPRDVRGLRWLFELYSGYLAEFAPHWERTPIADQIKPDFDRALRLRTQIFEACENPDTIGCGGEFVFGIADRSGLFHIARLPDAETQELPPKFVLSFPRGRATFRAIDLKPFGARSPSFAEMDAAAALRIAGFQCRVQSAGSKDAVEPRFAKLVATLRSEYQRTRKRASDFDAQCWTSTPFFPVYDSKAGFDVQLLTGHISPRGSRVQLENPVLLITPHALLLSARLDKSRVGGDTPE